MRILVTGSRDWDDEGAIRQAIAEITQLHGHGHVVVHGACPSGADAIADRVARSWGGGMSVEPHPADWHKYGKRAGFIRNLYMVNLGADITLAFIKNNSKGASMTARLAEEAGIPVRRFEA